MRMCICIYVYVFVCVCLYVYVYVCVYMDMLELRGVKVGNAQQIVGARRRKEKWYAVCGVASESLFFLRSAWVTGFKFFP